MTDELIRDHDPFSGHEAPSPEPVAAEPEKKPPAPAQAPESTPSPKARPARRGRRPRKPATEADVKAAAARMKK